MIVMERTNLRHVEELAGGPVPFAVADLSFISLLTVAPALARLTTPDAELVLLIKPQFEAGRARVGRGGIVRDQHVHRAVLDEITAGLAAAGLVVGAVIDSPLRGADGNVEFLARVAKGGSQVKSAELDAVVGQGRRERGSPSRPRRSSRPRRGAGVGPAHGRVERGSRDRRP